MPKQNDHRDEETDETDQPGRDRSDQSSGARRGPGNTGPKPVEPQYVWLPDDEAEELWNQFWRDIIDEVTAELERERGGAHEDDPDTDALDSPEAPA